MILKFSGGFLVVPGESSDLTTYRGQTKKTNERKAMKTVNRISKSWMCAAAALQLGLGAGAFAADNVDVPPDPYAPVWVRYLGFPDLNLLAWVFYRAPENIPADFNLRDFFDVGDRDGNGVFDPWDYPFLMQGHQIVDWGPPLLVYKASLQAIDEVPVWFCARDEAIAVLRTTGTITIGQLEAIGSLVKGTATFYHEELHPLDGAMPVVKYSYMATGLLEDGRQFAMHFSGSDHYSAVQYKENVLRRLEFK